MKGNKGEWSEFYVLIKLLADKNIVAASADLEKDESLHFPVVSISRNERGVHKEYRFATDGQILVTSAGVPLAMYSDDALKTKARSIFESIKHESKTFSIPEAGVLMDGLHITTLKADSTQKEDIRIIIHDPYTHAEQVAGFSIKSSLGSPATLLNASGATNFKYKITRCSDDIMAAVNSIETPSKMRDRVAYIIESGCMLQFQQVTSDIFTHNLRIIESTLPLILSEYVVAYYCNKGAKLCDLSSYILEHSKPLQQLGLSGTALVHKIKSLLHAAALGMVPATLWDGEMRAHGGYIIVREDGEIVCYNVFNIDQFREYIYANVKFDSPSVSRHGYGAITKEGDDYFILLNMQIRFVK